MAFKVNGKTEASRYSRLFPRLVWYSNLVCQLWFCLSDLLTFESAAQSGSSFLPPGTQWKSSCRTHLSNLRDSDRSRSRDHSRQRWHSHISLCSPARTIPPTTQTQSRPSVHANANSERIRTLAAATSTHGTRRVTVLVRPARGAGAGSVDGVAGCVVGTLARLVAAQAPGTTGAGDGAVYALPTWTETQPEGVSTRPTQASTKSGFQSNYCSWSYFLLAALITKQWQLSSGVTRADRL